jgi:predicted ribosome quality control (RQC) complex YloA/Tae2 family protein
MATPGQPQRGLSAVELAAVVAELQPVAGSVVIDITPLATPHAGDDLLLVLQRGGERGAKSFVHLVPGGARARLTTTARRFGKQDFGGGPARDVLQRELLGATLWHIGQPAGERCCTFGFRTRHGERRLVCELFGARGLWALLDAEGKVLALSRLVETDARTLRPGDAYRPAAGRTEARAAAASRFEAPVLAAVDAFFTALDLAAEAAREHDELLRATQRALQKQRDKVKGLGEQLADAGRSQAMRARADLMLAYAHTVQRGASQMTVPDPERDGEQCTLELDPSKPVVTQAQGLYEKARRLDDGRAIAEQRLAEATAAVAVLEQALADLDALAREADGAAERLETIRGVLRPFGVLPKPKRDSTPKASTKKTRADKFRHFVSAEGYAVLVGRDNEQNDELTMRLANGNDLWLHVGGGRAGSHVIVRLPKQKTASLETLLDAATLAVHFSKARGQARIEVVYTQRKHVRKPRGLPAGAVIPAQTKTISVHLDEARLKRLLDSAGGDAE